MFSSNFFLTCDIDEMHLIAMNTLPSRHDGSEFA